MLSWSLVTLLAAAPPTGFTVSVERVAVARTEGTPVVAVDPLAAKVTLKGLALTGKASRLCPIVERTAEGLTLRCESRRLWAELGKDAHGPFLDLREVTGVSWLDETLVPLRAWDLRSLLLPDSCPGELAAARGECALARGELEVARAAWTECLSTPDLGPCHLRLGELAMREGDVEAALAHYTKVTTHGPAGKLARLRACELLGTCLAETESARAADTATLAIDMSREVRLMSVRRELAAGRDARAMQWLLQGFEKDPDLCAGALPLCQKLVAVGLESDDAEARMGALSTFLSDKIRKGPAEFELNVRAAEAARDLGAPGFAATVLSANTPHVKRAELNGHLLQIVSLYLAARDPVRASVVLEYAEGKLGAAATRSGGWATARRQVGRKAATARAAPLDAPRPSLETLSTDVALSTDLARAAALRSKAALPPLPEAPETAP